MTDRIIKSKERVQKHGEVFTPRWVVDKMLDQEGVREACESLEATFLEPSAGEGIFLQVILERKLGQAKKMAVSLEDFESYSLLALSSLYGIELLEDNVQICTINLYQGFHEAYEKACLTYDKKPRDRVLKSARTIISTNIEQGDFLTRKKLDQSPIIITEWQPKTGKTTYVTRTEYSLDEIYDEASFPPGRLYGDSSVPRGQLSMFDLLEMPAEDDKPIYRYKTCDIRNVYKEELEEVAQDEG